MNEPVPDPQPAGDPIERFRVLLRLAGEREASLPERMVLATADARGRPSARYMLLKGVEAGESEGFTFFSNRESRKGRELGENPWASLVFHWVTLGEQVRVEGRVVELPPERADDYWNTRPRAYRIGAWASAQSRPVPDRATIAERFAELETRFENQEVPRPDYWIGYRLIPDRIEFWTQGEARLHDRILYIREERGWRTEVLQP